MGIYRVTLYTEDCQGHQIKVTGQAYYAIRRILADIRGHHDRRRLRIESTRGVVFDQPLGRLLPILEWEELSK